MSEPHFDPRRPRRPPSRRRRPLESAGAAEAEAGLFLDAIASLLTPVTVHFLWRPQLSDPEDEMVFEAAINGGADAIVTFERRTFEQAGRRFGIEIETPGLILARIRA